MIPGDLPTTIQSSISNVDAQAQAGVTWDATPKVSGADTQPAYTPRVQIAKAKGSNYVYDGSNDVAMVRMRSEAAAQGLSSVKLWACSLACYTKLFLTQGGANVEGTYLWIQYLPIEEANLNASEGAYVKAIGDKEVSWAAQSWQAALAFKQAADTIVQKSGPNALTRASLMQALNGMTDFTAGGWIGKKSLHGAGTFSPCFVILQVQNGKFVRVYPTQPGTMDCNPSNVVNPTVDPVAEAAKLK
jgi:ABC-type branched-subunit amino acid transport system substrate-binding protein